MELDPALQTYVAESRELLAEMEEALLRLEQEDDQSESLSAIFRAAHTIKGSAGLFGLEQIVEFTHVVESLLDKLRDHDIPVDADITALLLECGDQIGVLIDLLEQGVTDQPAEVKQAGDALIVRLAHYTTVAGGEHTVAESSAITPPVVSSDDGDGPCVGTDNWHISLRFCSSALQDGMDPLSFLRYLETVGQIVNLEMLDDALPSWDDFDPELCYLGFEINFKSDADKQTIEDVFEFVREGSVIRILPPRSRIHSYISLINELPEDDMRLGELLVQCGTLTQHELKEALEFQQNQARSADASPLGEVLVEQGMTHKPVVEAALEKQSSNRSVTGQESKSVRVDADKLDNLISLIGELVIAGAGTSLCAYQTGDSALIESASNLTRMVEEVRDSALRLRMVQIGSTFNKFKRVVRDVANELGKDIDLVITGAETDLDKTVVEKIGDPLMHLVRNSMDHGIESAEERVACGKPERGTLNLNAYHDSGNIVIEVVDDGGGLDRGRILDKAVEKGIVHEGVQLEDSEIYNLIFEPGFSTADEVTNLSGRGVGMDVVKRNITALRGSIELESKPGKGSTFRIRLPLTLAIIDGFLVAVEDSSFVIPLEMVIECVELEQTEQESSGGRDYINLRGEVLPFIRLRDLFSLGGRPPKRENVVVVQYAGSKAGLVVDQLMGEFQTVIKPLGQIFRHVKGVSGSTILGNGAVALILDVQGLVQKLVVSEPHSVSAVS